jgi:hypothetical protein
MTPEEQQARQIEQDRLIAQLMEQLLVQGKRQEEQNERMRGFEAFFTNPPPIFAASSSSAVPPGSRIRGDKVPIFCGKPGDNLNNWLHKVDLIIAESGESRHDKIIASVTQGLHDEAYTWFRAACDSKVISPLSSWDVLKAALIARFAPVDELQVSFIWLLDVVPGQAGLSVEAIGVFISDLRSKASTCRDHLSDQFLIVILLRALPPGIKSQLALQITPTMTLEDATSKAFRLARTLALEGLLERSTGLSTSSLPALPPLSGSVPMDLAAVVVDKPRRDNKCKYCHQPGHWFRDKNGKATCPVLIRAEADAAVSKS